jgi:hypothetical protein
MNPLEVLKHLRTRPFRPIRIFLSDGSFHNVRHPELAFVSRREVAIAREPLADELPESFVYCDPMHVTRIEPLAEELAEESEQTPSSD